ncbi:MAG: helix-turn-helix domain-containing protein [Myxococcaceae bacterium]
MQDEENQKANQLRRLREERLLSKAELARRAGVSVLTIDRVERGAECRLDTKRKIILALGLKVTEREKVFGGSQPDSDRKNGR